MKTSLMPPGLAVVSARIGRFGQSWADAATVVAMKTMAIKRRDKQSTAHTPRNFSRSGNPIAVRGETEQALHAIITRPTRLRDPPLVGAAPHVFPVSPIARLVGVVDLQDLGGIFRRHLVRSAEIGEDITSRSVPSGTPFDRVAAVLHAPDTAHYRIGIRHFEHDVVECRQAGLRQHDRAMVVIGAMQKP